MKDTVYIIVPGLGDRTLFLWFYALIAYRWSRGGLQTVVFMAEWERKEGFDGKIRRLKENVDRYEQQGRRVVLVGVSAGATLCILALVQCPQARVALVSGLTHLKHGSIGGTLLRRLSWLQAGRAAERVMQNLSDDERQKILCMMPSADGLIGLRHVKVEGAAHYATKSRGHLASIISALSRDRHKIVEFAEGTYGRKAV